MTKYFPILVISAFFFALPSYAAADEVSSNGNNENEIQWLLFNQPSYYIAKEPWKGIAPANVIFNHLQALLPEYSHTKKLILSSKDVVEAITDNQNSCISGLFKYPNFEKKTYYSKNPSVFVPPPQVVILTENKPLFGNTESINLENLLEKNQFTLGLHETRRHGGIIDSMIVSQRNNPKTKIYPASGPRGYIDVYQDLVDRKVDFTIATLGESHVIEVNVYASPHFTTYSIDEQQGLSKAYINCTRNEWGKKILARIDPILTGKDYIDVVQKSFTYWMSPDDAVKYQQAHAKAVDEHYGKIE